MNRVSTDEVHEAIKKPKNNMSHFLLIGAKIVKFHQKKQTNIFSQTIFASQFMEIGVTFTKVHVPRSEKEIDHN